MHPFIPKIEMLIAAQLEEHKYCTVKRHELVVCKNKVLLKHKKQITAEDKIIASLRPIHIKEGLTSKEWDWFSEDILRTVLACPGSNRGKKFVLE